MNKNYIYLGIIILSLLISNIYSYKVNKDIKDELVNIDRKESKVEYLYSHRHRVQKAFLNNNNNAFRLIVLFSCYGCNPAIESVLKNIKTRKEYLRDHIDYYYLESENETDYAFEYLNRRIDLNIIKMDKEILNGYITVDNPVILLVDNNGYVYDTHKSVKGNKNATDIFFKRIENIFKSI
jgi:thioredoxin-related protein